MSPRRPDPKAVLEADARQGREAVYGTTRRAAAEPKRLTWEERHKRVTFHCPTDLLDEIQDESARSGRTKNSIIVDALRAGVGKKKR